MRLYGPRWTATAASPSGVSVAYTSPAVSNVRVTSTPKSHSIGAFGRAGWWWTKMLGPSVRSPGWVPGPRLPKLQLSVSADTLIIDGRDCVVRIGGTSQNSPKHRLLMYRPLHTHVARLTLGGSQDLFVLTAVCRAGRRSVDSLGGFCGADRGRWSRQSAPAQPCSCHPRDAESNGCL
jgi:hypothetical protein